MTCQHCGAQTNGVVLCARCRTTLDVALEGLPAYHAGLFSIGTPARIRGRGRGEPVDPTGNSINRRADGDSQVEAAAAETRNMLSTWSRLLVEERPGLVLPADTVAAMAKFLRTNLSSIITLAWAGELMTEALAFERRLKQLLARGQGHWFGGICGAPRSDAAEDWCPADLWVQPGVSYIRCKGCGANWSVEDRRALVIASARDELMSIADIARVVVALVDGEPSQQRLESRLQKWVQRKQLGDYGVRVLTPGQQPRRVYRLGEVMDRLESEQRRTRAERTVEVTVTLTQATADA